MRNGLKRTLNFDGHKLQIVESPRSERGQEKIILDSKLPKIGPAKSFDPEQPELVGSKPSKNRILNLDFFSCLQKARYKNRLSDKEASNKQERHDISARYEEKLFILSKKQVKKDAHRVMKLLESGQNILSRSLQPSPTHSKSRVSSEGNASKLTSHRLLSQSQLGSGRDLGKPAAKASQVGMEWANGELMRNINKSIARDQDEQYFGSKRQSGESSEQSKQRARILLELERTGQPKPWEVELKDTKTFLRFSPNLATDNPYDLLMGGSKARENKAEQLKRASNFLKSLASPKRLAAGQSESPESLRLPGRPSRRQSPAREDAGDRKLLGTEEESPGRIRGLEKVREWQGGKKESSYKVLRKYRAGGGQRPVERVEENWTPFPLENWAGGQEGEDPETECVRVVGSLGQLHEAIGLQEYPELIRKGELRAGSFKRKAQGHTPHTHRISELCTFN